MTFQQKPCTNYLYQTLEMFLHFFGNVRSVNIWQSYSHNKSGTIFLARGVVNPTRKTYISVTPYTWKHKSLTKR